MLVSDTDQFMLDAYSGLGSFSDGGYLVPHTRENQAKFNRRRDLSTYPNYTRKVVNTYLAHLFQRAARRESDQALWQAFAKDADGTGSSIEKVMRRGTRLAMLLGTVALVVDRPQGTPTNRAQEDSLQAYVAIRLPRSISNVVLDEFGDLASITFAESVPADPRGLNTLTKTVYRTYTVQGWKLTVDREGTEIISQGVYDLGGVPVAFLHSSEVLVPGTWRAQPFAWDVAVENYNLYNLYSELREILRTQTFSVLTIPLTEKIEKEVLAALFDVSTEKALIYNPAGGGAPSYISPNSQNAEVYMQELEASVNRIYRCANIDFASGSLESSGIALAFRFQEANRAISMLADLTEQAEREVAHWVARWSGTEFDGTIVYSRDFSLLDLQSEVKTALDAITIDIGPVFEVALKKKMARLVLGSGTSDELFQEIDEDIDKHAEDKEKEDQLRQEALLQAQAQAQAQSQTQSDQSRTPDMFQQMTGSAKIGGATGTKQ